jgi:hypothetical protein
VNPLLAAALEIQGFLESREWAFAFIGGLAVIRWGEPRTTQDADLTLLTGFGNEERFVDPLLGQFRSRIAGARAFALDRRVLLLESSDGTPLDISLGGLPFESGLVERATPFEFAEGCRLVTCSAEDLIVLKAFASRPQDWRDIEGVFARRGPYLDLQAIRDHLMPLVQLKGKPEIMDRLSALIPDR